MLIPIQIIVDYKVHTGWSSTHNEEKKWGQISVILLKNPQIMDVIDTSLYTKYDRRWLESGIIKKINQELKASTGMEYDIRKRSV